MKAVGPEQRGIVSGLLNLSRNLGLITGASAMGAVFAWGSGASDIAAAHPAEVEAGMQIMFVVAAFLVIFAIIVAVGSRRAARRFRSRDVPL